ncbi:MAG: hypothetical protein GF315_07320 [candidate division Zixibacteria bacterium]|nr:hypothetical protein [candidate division Zixibacteria bacterium]
MGRLYKTIISAIRPNIDLILWLFGFKFATVVALFLPLNVLVMETWSASDFPNRLLKGDYLFVLFETINADPGGFRQYAVFFIMLLGIIWLAYQFLIAGVYGKYLSRRDEDDMQFNIFYYSGSYFLSFFKLAIFTVFISAVFIIAIFIFSAIFTSFSTGGGGDFVVYIWAAIMIIIWLMLISFFLNCCRASVALNRTTGVRDTFKAVWNLWKRNKLLLMESVVMLYAIAIIVIILYFVVANVMGSLDAPMLIVYLFLIFRQLISALLSLSRFLFVSGSVEFMKIGFEKED